MKLCIVCLVLLACSCVCRAGVVHTRDGQELSGDLALEAGVVVVHSQKHTDKRLNFSDIANIDFSQPAATQPAEAPGQGGLKAEYFLGNAFDASKRKVLRLDPVIDFTWRYNRDALFMQNDRDWIPFCVRWTGQIRPLYSESYTLRMRDPLPESGEIHAKVWIDNKQIIEDGSESGEVTLQAGHLHDLRIELVATRSDRRNRPGTIRLTWESPSQKKQLVPADCFYVGPNISDPPIMSRILSPLNNTIASTTDALQIDARVEPGKRKIDHVELWAGKLLLKTFQSQPYQFTWTNPRPGDYDLRVIAFAQDGLKSSSGPLRLMVGDNDAGKITNPWARFNIGAPQHDEKVTIADKKITLVRTGGELYAMKDKCQFLYQLFTGDGEIVAKLDDVSPDTAAGLMIRKSLAEDSLECGVLFQPGAGTVSLRRTIDARSSINTASASPAPGYLKLAREGNIIRLYRSEDGTIWQFVDQQEIDLPQTVLIGAVISCQSANTASATFENLTVTAAQVVENNTPASGVMLNDGSQLTGDIIDIEKAAVTIERGSKNNRKRITVNLSDVARINIHRPDTPSTDAEDPGWHGVVLSHGDIYEGDVRILDRHGVQVNSEVLGRRQFSTERDLAAVVFGPVQTSASSYEVLLTDGSILHSAHVEIVDGGLLVDTAFAKGFHVELKELLRLKTGDR